MGAVPEFYGNKSHYEIASGCRASLAKAEGREAGLFVHSTVITNGLPTLPPLQRIGMALEIPTSRCALLGMTECWRR